MFKTYLKSIQCIRSSRIYFLKINNVVINLHFQGTLRHTIEITNYMFFFDKMTSRIQQNKTTITSKTMLYTLSTTIWKKNIGILKLVNSIKRTITITITDATEQ